MDEILGGSVPRGAFLLIDVDSSVSPLEIRTILNMMRANFINQNGPCVIVHCRGVPEQVRWAGCGRPESENIGI